MHGPLLDDWGMDPDVLDAILAAEAESLAAWRAPLPVDPVKDDAVRALFVDLQAGRLWEASEAWDYFFLDAAERAYRGVLASVGVPLHRRETVLEQLHATFSLQCMGGRDVRVPGWAAIAARVVEAAVGEGSGVADGLVRGLPAPGASALASCAAHRGELATTVRRLWTLPSEQGAARVAVHLAQEGFASRLLLTDAIRRLDEHADLEVRQATLAGIARRHRSRMRAYLAEFQRDWLVERLLALPSLHARCVAATGRAVWSWAWNGVRRDFPMNPGDELVSPCDPRGEMADGLPGEVVPVLQTWVLLVAMRGRLPQLRQWVDTGSAGRDSTWNRLHKTVPASLRVDGKTVALRRVLGDPWDAGRVDGLEAMVEANLPVLAGLAAVEATSQKELAPRWTALLDPVWEADVPRPRNKLLTMHEHVAASLVLASSWGLPRVRGGVA